MRGLFLLVFSLMFEFKAINKSTHQLNQTEQNKPERIDKDGGDKKKHLYVLRCSAQDEFCLTHFLHKITAAYNTNSWFIKNLSPACNSYWNHWGQKGNGFWSDGEQALAMNGMPFMMTEGLICMSYGNSIDSKCWVQL